MSRGLDQAFSLAAAELGMASAAWLFSDEVVAQDGAAGLQSLRDELGRRWPVVDAICAARAAGRSQPPVSTTSLLTALEGLTRVLIVGHEARWLDPLLAALPPTVRVGLLRWSELNPDWERLRSNFGGRLELVSLNDFQQWAGTRSAMLTFVYGAEPAGPFALASWVRVSGPDVRTQFRELIGWEVLGVPLSVYPRWLVAMSASDFTRLESSS